MITPLFFIPKLKTYGIKIENPTPYISLVESAGSVGTVIVGSVPELMLKVKW